MSKYLENNRIAVLVANGFDNRDYFSVTGKLKQHGIKVTVISPEEDRVKSSKAFEDDVVVNSDNENYFIRVDQHPEDANPCEFQLLFIPGGVFSIYKLISDNESSRFAKNFYDLQKPIALISHGVRILSEFENIKGRLMTSPVEYKDFFRKMGAFWMNDEVVVDENLITCNEAKNIDVFTESVIQALMQGMSIDEFKKKLREKRRKKTDSFWAENNANQKLRNDN